MPQALTIINITLILVGCLYSTKSYLGRCILLPVLLSVFFYTLWPAGEQTLFSISPFRGESLSKEAAFLIQLSTTASLASTIILFHLIQKALPSIECNAQRHVTTYRGAGTNIALLCGISGLFISTGFQPWNLADYEQARGIAYGNPIVALSRMTIGLSCALKLQTAANKKQLFRFQNIIWSATPILLAFYTSNKHSVLPIAAFFITFYAEYIYRKSKKRSIKQVFIYATAFFTLVFFLAGALGFMKFFSMTRGNGNVKQLTETIIDSRGAFLSITASDPGGPYMSLSEQFNQSISDEVKTGITDRLISITPRFLLPFERPHAIDIKYAMTVLKKDWEPGLGVGYHPLADANLHLGNLLAFVYLPATTIVAILGYMIITSIFPFSSTRIIILFVLFGGLLISHRTMIEGFIKGLLSISITACIITSLSASAGLLLKKQTKHGKTIL